MTEINKKITRQEFLKVAGGASAAVLASSVVLGSCEESAVELGPGQPVEKRVIADCNCYCPTSILNV
jgi:hypothetical protein